MAGSAAPLGMGCAGLPLNSEGKTLDGIRILTAFDKKKAPERPAVTAAKHKKGDFLVDYEEKVFEDVKAKPGEKALVTFHTVAFEGSIGFVNLLQATRLKRKGYETSVLLYGPGVTLGVQRGFPT